MKPENTVWSSEWIYMWLESLSKGVKDCDGPPDPAIVVHIGDALALSCDFEGRLPSRSETREAHIELSIRLPRKLMREIAEHSDLDPGRVQIREQFNTRDPHLQHVRLALKAELEAGFPNVLQRRWSEPGFCWTKGNIHYGDRNDDRLFKSQPFSASCPPNTGVSPRQLVRSTKENSG
jgi:hypothetical protein